MIERSLCGARVSFLGFGAGQIGDERLPEGQVESLLLDAVECGINFIDTARGYGVSEERIGKYLAGRRKDLILSTKVGYSAPGHADWTYGAVTEGVTGALRRLRTDHIDIVMLHSCPKEILMREEIRRGLEDTVAAGKVLHPGYSGENDDLDFALTMGFFEVIETSINVCDQRGIDRFLPLAREGGVGVIAKRPIANAFWRFPSRPAGHYCEAYWERWNAMGPPDYGMELNDLAVRFLLHLEGISSAIIGTTSIDNLRKNIAILERGRLPEEIVDDLRQRFRRHDEGWEGQI